MWTHFQSPKVAINVYLSLSKWWFSLNSQECQEEGEEIWNFFFLSSLFLKKDFLSKLRIVFRISYTRKFPKSSQTDTFQSGSWIIRLSVCFFTPLIVVYSLKLRVWLWKYSPWLLLLERNKKDPQKAFMSQCYCYSIIRSETHLHCSKKCKKNVKLFFILKNQQKFL